MGKLISTLVGVLIAVGGFSALWVGANLVFNQATRNFRLFSAAIGAICGAVLMIVIDGNQLLTGLVVRPGSLFNGDEPGLFSGGLGDALAGHLFWPVVGAAIGAALGYGLAVLDDRRWRLALAIGVGVGSGLILSLALKSRYELAMRSTPLILWTVVFIAIGLAMAWWRKTSFLTGAATGAMIGWLLGSFGGAVQGVSVANQMETTVAFVVAGLLAGIRLGLSNRPDQSSRASIDDRSRAWLFVGPAVLFISIMLVIPAIQTVLLSLQEDDAENIVDGFVGLDNYLTVLDDPNNLDAANVSNLFTSPSETSISWFPWGGSAILPWVLFFAVVGVVLAWLLGRETGQRINFGGAPIFPLILAAGLFSFALFTHLRGTLINNLWWVLAVTLLATSLGLAIAKMADGARFESVAKSFVFMPMAISFVGASIVWRFVYNFRPEGFGEQIGILNGLWVSLGREPVAWLLQEPFNNFYLMVILVWLQVGFAMVILSAGIKSVPDEIIEAARIDGANELQVFWRVIIPSISSTLVVVLTTIVITVWKVFDIVFVMTSGEFGTSVVAERMVTEFFTFGNDGRGAAIAVVLLVAIIPLMVLNVKRFQAQEAQR